MCFQWVNDRIKKLNCFDVGVLKLCVAAFVLMVAKLWPGVLGLEWYWYGIVFVLAKGYMLVKVFGK